MRFFSVMRFRGSRSAVLLSSMLLSGAALLSLQPIQRGLAQSSPTCDPPGANEYLLLVTNQQADTEEQLRQLLPANAAITSCQYLEDQVVRVGGFANAEIADAWAKYVTDTTGLPAFVARPTAEAAAAPAAPTPAPDDTAADTPSFPTPTQVPAAGATTPTPSAPAQSNTAELPSLNQAPTPSVSPSPSPSVPAVVPSPTAPAPSAAPSTPAPASSPAPTAAASPAPSANPAFAPKPLGSGYAVLVNYANRPEVAADVRQVTSQPVGLVSYNQRPFLLAAYTADPAVATAVLQALNDRGFNAIIIDSRSAILLTPAVVGTGS